eukprot:6209801-Pleurochrysis_carterae.AAC.1
MLSSTGWAFTFDVSCLEIYNEELRDLLASSNGKLKLVDAGERESGAALGGGGGWGSRCDSAFGALASDTSSRCVDLSVH